MKPKGSEFSQITANKTKVQIADLTKEDIKHLQMKSLITRMIGLTLLMGAISIPARPQKPAGGFPYQPTYSSSFEIGDPAQARMVLELWKDYDENALDRHASWFADTAVIYLASGEVVRGLDSMLAGVKKYRSSIAKVKTTLHAWVSLRSTDRKENWVALWATEEDTSKDGTTTAVSLHEIWRINRAGKIDEIRQYAQEVPAPQKE